MTGLIFQGFSVQRMLEGKKTATRRLTHWPKQDATPVTVAKVPNLWLALDEETERPIAGFTYRSHSLGKALYVKESYLLQDDGSILYKADLTPEKAAEVKKWGNPIFMKEIYARLYVLVTDVHIQRVHEMTEADARAEGARSLADFQRVWDTLHIDDRWETNPWVCAYTFTVHHIPEAT